MLRFGLANAYLAKGQFDTALLNAKLAVEFDPDYSAAWRLLGQLFERLQRFDEAKQAYRSGILVADRNRDQQLAREMRVFSARLDRKR